MSEYMPPLVSVVVINFRGPEDTIRCVESLNAQNWPADRLEIIVVENGSGDDSAAILKDGLRDDVKFIVSPNNLGFAGGANLGASKASGSIIGFINSDAKADPNWVRNGIEPLTKSLSVGIVASRVLDWDGNLVDFAGANVTWFGMAFRSLNRDPNTREAQSAKNVLYGTGAALFVRSSVFAELGGFDENLFMFYEDLDLGWRANLLGHQVRYEPSSTVFHKHHVAMEKFGHYRETFLLERNALAVMYKNLDDENLNKVLGPALALLARRATAAGTLRAADFSLNSAPKGTDDPDTIEVSKESLSGLLAVDDFVTLLPKLAESRKKIQKSRKVPDHRILRLFGDVFNALSDDQRVKDGFGTLLDSFDLKLATQRPNVLVITADRLGKKMAGPAIRAWKIAEAVSKVANVRLVTTNKSFRTSTDFDVYEVVPSKPAQMARHEKWADVIIFQGYQLEQFDCLERSRKILVPDLYDPMHLEQLAQGQAGDPDFWKATVRGATQALNAQILRGDFFMCASERQRLLWIGQLGACGRLNPQNYADDESLKSLLAIVPFGLEQEIPAQTEHAIKGKVPGIGPDDKVIIWGGGIYEWFDTESLVRAMAIVAKDHPDAKLFFLGMKHPNPDVGEMPVATRTRDLAADLGLTNSSVFFNESWVQLDERHNYLLDADAGVSTHFLHLETTFSFRTRILDYLWAGLPIISTEGDTFGDLVRERTLGVAVPERDPEALAKAIVSVLYDPKLNATARENVQQLRDEFTWDSVLAPLVEFCADPHFAADRIDFKAAVAREGATRAALGVKRTEFNYNLARIMMKPAGLKRDIALAQFYLRSEGLAGLRKRASDRRLRHRIARLSKHEDI